LAGAQRQESLVFDESGNVIETHEHAGEFALLRLRAPLMATTRLVIASVCACVITAAGIHVGCIAALLRLSAVHMML
jgi:hypothetical protein